MSIELDRHISMLSSSCDSEVYPYQTKILEDRTNISEHVSWEALFKGVRGRFGLKDVDPTGFVSVEITKPDMIPVTNTI
jgi:hypothetical protein